MIFPLKQSDKGPKVRELQRLLVERGYSISIGGNKSPNVQGFSYVFSRMDKLLGFGHVAWGVRDE
jgi:peptidoglycan hydrolase-like protein with peptidoglycan-binding domain